MPRMSRAYRTRMAAAETLLQFTAVETDADVAEWVDVFNRVCPSRPDGPAQVRHYWELAPHSWSVIARRDGRAVGVAHAESQHWVPGSTRADADVAVLPDVRRQGVGAELYRRVSGWARERGLTGLEVWIYDADRDAPGFWANRGFEEVGRERVSMVDVRRAAALAAGLPDGIELVTLDGRAHLEHGMYRVAVGATGDIPGPDVYDAGDFAHWRAAEVRRPGLMEEGSVIALAGGEVVGFAIVVRCEGRPDVAEHEMTAVAPAWRGRGIARAMKARTIALAREAGLSHLESMNEARNASILAVNAHLGYEHVGDFLQLHGPLAP